MRTQAAARVLATALDAFRTPAYGVRLEAAAAPVDAEKAAEEPIMIARCYPKRGAEKRAPVTAMLRFEFDGRQVRISQ
jgi:hypothetical protein